MKTVIVVSNHFFSDKTSFDLIETNDIKGVYENAWKNKRRDEWDIIVSEITDQQAEKLIGDLRKSLPILK